MTEIQEMQAFNMVQPLTELKLRDGSVIDWEEVFNFASRNKLKEVEENESRLPASCTYQWQAEGSGNPREFDCGMYPQGGDFDRTSCMRLVLITKEQPNPVFCSLERRFFPQWPLLGISRKDNEVCV